MEAKTRVESCYRIGSETLDLRGLRLSRLPEAICNLRRVKSIDLSGNRLGAHAAKVLSLLPQLTSLDISDNNLGEDGAKYLTALAKLTSLSAASNNLHTGGAQYLSRLLNLKFLDVSENGLGAEAAAVIATLSRLEFLNLSGNQIGVDGASALPRLANLISLSLADGLIGAKGAAYIGCMRQLLELNLDGNGIASEGLESLCSISGLRVLKVSENGIADIRALSKLRELEHLSLSSNRIEFWDTNVWFAPRLKEVILDKSILGSLPVELLSKHHAENCLPRLQTYFTSPSEKKAKEPDTELRDVKVMILGNGRIGKTQMRRRLGGENYDDSIASTHGVEIVEAALRDQDGSSTPLRLWDFGGQEIYLGTHALFLKTRAVFPILWTPATERNEVQEVAGQLFRNYPLKEWVRYVQALAGPRSAVLIVQSQCESADQAESPPVEPATAETFAFGVRSLHYSAKTLEGEASFLTALRAAVTWQARERGPVRIPADWARIKSAIEKLHGDPSARRMTRAEFYSLCTKVGPETNKERAHMLLDLLHQFGVLFHDPEIFDDLIIIDQNWALQAIYSVFDRSPAGAYYTLKNRMSGRFTKGDLGRLVWDKYYSGEEQDAFIAMMRACAIAFPLREATDDEETLFIAPELLPRREKVEAELRARWDPERHTDRIELPFVFLAPSLLRELMRVWGSIAGQSGLYWSEGLSFFDAETGAKAVLEVRRPEKASWAGDIIVEAQGPNSEVLISRLVDRALDVAERFGAKPKGSEGEGAEAISRRIRRLRNSWATNVAGSSVVAPSAAPLVRERCFISYAHGDDSDLGKERKAAFAAVRSHLPSIGLDPFFDEERLTHGESISAFIRLGAESPKFVMILSGKYLRSPFCMDELRRIWRACGQERNTFQKRTRAVCLPDAKIETMMEREEIRDYWVERRTEWRALKQKRESAGDRLGLEEYHEYDAAEHLAATVASILLDITDTLHIRSIADIGRIQFS